MKEFITTHWDELLAGVLILSSILNAITKHYSESSPGIARFAGALLDALSFIPSKGTAGPGGSNVKLPGSLSPRPLSEENRERQRRASGLVPRVGSEAIYPHDEVTPTDPGKLKASPTGPQQPVDKPQ